MTDEEQAKRVAAALSARGQSLAVVECTLGGALGGALTGVAGASGWFVAGLAPYSSEAKRRLLGLGREAFGDEGAVSAAAAALLAAAARERLGADWALAETGVAGPRGTHRSAKEPGTAYLCLVGPDGARAERSLSTGLDDRAANRRAIQEAALALLVAHLSAI